MSGGNRNRNETTQSRKRTDKRMEKRTSGKKKSGGVSALVKNKMSKPGMKMVEMRARSGERWSVAAAKMQEKMAHWGASMKLGLYSATHSFHPMRREAAKQSMLHKKAAATERRNQKIANAHSIASAKRAKAQESRAARLNQAVH